MPQRCSSLNYEILAKDSNLNEYPEPKLITEQIITALKAPTEVEILF